MKPKIYVMLSEGRYKAEYSLPGSQDRIYVGMYSTRHIAHQHAIYAGNRACHALPVIDRWLTRPAVRLKK